MSKKRTLNQEDTDERVGAVGTLANEADRWFLSLARGLGRTARVARDEATVVASTAEKAGTATKSLWRELLALLKQSPKLVATTRSSALRDLENRERFLLRKLGALALRHAEHPEKIQENALYDAIVQEIRTVREEQAQEIEACPAQATGLAATNNDASSTGRSQDP